MPQVPEALRVWCSDVLHVAPELHRFPAHLRRAYVVTLDPVRRHIVGTDQAANDAAGIANAWSCRAPIAVLCDVDPPQRLSGVVHGDLVGLHLAPILRGEWMHGLDLRIDVLAVDE